MATSDMGLFGPTPYEIQQAQQQSLQQNAAAYANQSPLQRAAQGMYQAGGMLGGMAAGGLGMVNPQVEQAATVQSVQKDIDHSTPEGLLEGAQKLKDVNPALAAKYVQASQAMKMQNSRMTLEESQAKKALAYQPAASNQTREYQDQVDILTDPDSTDDQRKFAQARIDALNAKGVGKGGILGAGTVKRMATSIGEVIFDPASKKYTYADGSDIASEDLRKMTPLGNDPTNAAAVSMAKSGSKTKADAMAKAQDALPEATNTYNQAIDLMGQIDKDPAFSSLVGFTWTPGAKYIPGSKEAGLDAKLQQLSALAEMHQREKLKGTGQITDYESNMARGAILRASTAQSESAYRKAMSDFNTWMGKSMEALNQRANSPFKMPETQAIAQPRNVAPTVSPTPSSPTTPFSFTTPQQVKQALGKTISREQARAILMDMQSRGIEIK